MNNNQDTTLTNLDEINIAILEASEIYESDEYFKARPQIDSNDRRKVFNAGYTRGWQATTKASESEINSLKERVAELQADNNKFREALELVREEYKGLPHSLGYEFTHLPIINKALSSTHAQ